MTMRGFSAFAALICVFSPALAYAGPCADDLYRASVDIGKRLDEIAAKGKGGAEFDFRHRASSADPVECRRG